MALEPNRLTLEVIGDSGPFSVIGKSIGYRVSYGGLSYLLDCGAPLFQQLGAEGVRGIQGLFLTHSHDDHKRWFSDLALFLFYTTRPRKKLKLITSPTVAEEVHRTSRAALEMSLSADSKRVVDIPYSEFVEQIPIGPRPRFRIVRSEGTASGEGQWRVVDEHDRQLPPDRAKVFVSEWGSRPRMLFRDPETGLWVEPSSYYALSDSAFHGEDHRVYVEPSTGLMVICTIAPEWHGPPTVGFVFQTPEGDKLAFSSDTVRDLDLWQHLEAEVRPLPESFTSIADLQVVVGDINPFIQKTWSRRRLEEATQAYSGAAVVHDVAGPRSVVHSDYKDLHEGEWSDLILTHSPDEFVSEIPLMVAGMKLEVKDSRFRELVNGSSLPLNADFFIKWNRGYFAARLDDSGRMAVRSTGHTLRLVSEPCAFCPGDLRVELYEYLDGRYYLLTEVPGELRRRADGKVERLIEHPDGSRGTIVEDVREQVFPEAGNGAVQA